MKQISLLLMCLAICLSLTSCVYNTTTPLNPEATEVIIRKADAPIGCQEMGAVAGYDVGIKATDFIGIVAVETPDGTMNRIKNEAAKLGANWVTITTPGSGIAYRCSPSVIN
jgi:hypothetical protein